MFISSNSGEVASLLALLDYGVTKLLFVDFSQVHHLLDGALTDKSEYLDIATLSNSEYTVLSLLINGRIPAGIKQDNTIGSSNVQTSPSTLLRDQE